MTPNPLPGLRDDLGVLSAALSTARTTQDQ
jgi:hypothetical protein